MTAAGLYQNAVRYRAECDLSTQRKVLESLNWWTRRSEGHQSNFRRQARSQYDAVVATAVQLDTPNKSLVLRMTALVQARNLSSGGIGLLAAPLYLPETASDDTPVLAADELFRLGRTIGIGLRPRKPDELWLEGEIVRVRKVHQGFLEVGIRFVRRAARTN